jgi:hypothetical protein
MIQMNSFFLPVIKEALAFYKRLGFVISRQVMIVMVSIAFIKMGWRERVQFIETSVKKKTKRQVIEDCLGGYPGVWWKDQYQISLRNFQVGGQATWRSSTSVYAVQQYAEHCTKNERLKTG